MYNESMTTEAQKKASERYDKANTKLVVLKLNKKTDCDVLDRLDEVPSKQGYIKKLVRDDIKKQ